MLEIHDGAFIGSLIGRTPASEASNDFSDTVYTFDVTEWIKGDRSPGPFDISSAGDGAACGFEVQPGQEVAVYISVSNGIATGGLCSTTNASDLIEMTKAPTISDIPIPSQVVEDLPVGTIFVADDIGTDPDTDTDTDTDTDELGDTADADPSPTTPLAADAAPTTDGGTSRSTTIAIVLAALLLAGSAVGYTRRR